MQAIRKITPTGISLELLTAFIEHGRNFALKYQLHPDFVRYPNSEISKGCAVANAILSERETDRWPISDEAFNFIIDTIDVTDDEFDRVMDISLILFDYLRADDGGEAA